MEFHAPVWYLKEFCGDCAVTLLLSVLNVVPFSQMVLKSKCKIVLPTKPSVRIAKKSESQIFAPLIQIKYKLQDFSKVNINKM